jgi:hypothetical protein
MQELHPGFVKIATVIVEHPEKRGCAFTQVRHVLDPRHVDAKLDHIEYATKLGLTTSHALGVMDGWDSASKPDRGPDFRRTWHSYLDVFVEPEYAQGHAMGRKLFALTEIHVPK